MKASDDNVHTPAVDEEALERLTSSNSSAEAVDNSRTTLIFEDRSAIFEVSIPLLSKATVIREFNIDTVKWSHTPAFHLDDDTMIIEEIGAFQTRALLIDNDRLTWWDFGPAGDSRYHWADIRNVAPNGTVLQSEGLKKALETNTGVEEEIIKTGLDIDIDSFITLEYDKEHRWMQPASTYMKLLDYTVWVPRWWNVSLPIYGSAFERPPVVYTKQEWKQFTEAFKRRRLNLKLFPSPDTNVQGQKIIGTVSTYDDESYRSLVHSSQEFVHTDLMRYLDDDDPIVRANSSYTYSTLASYTIKEKLEEVGYTVTENEDGSWSFQQQYNMEVYENRPEEIAKRLDFDE